MFAEAAAHFCIMRYMQIPPMVSDCGRRGFSPNYHRAMDQPSRRGLAAMKAQRPISDDDDHRVVPFRPRAALTLPRDQQTRAQRPATAQSHSPKEQARESQGPEKPDEFRHRMAANLAALAFTLALTGIGIWLAISLADMRKTQDCVLMGRRDCAQIGSPQG